MTPELPRAARVIQQELAGLRHELHRRPEIGLHLPRTQATVLRALNGLGLEITCGDECSSVVAVLRGDYGSAGESRRTVLLRADMDALPITEELAVPYRSEHPGSMHACGHDLHTAMLVGAAKVLSARRDGLPGDVVFMFQPGEEGHDGAGIMLREGVLEAAGRAPDAAWALHVLSGRMPNGVVTGRPGATMSASNELHVTVRGRGGHGAAPHTAKDPVPVAAEMVTGLQTLVSRTVSPFEPVVLTIGALNAGTQANVIPGIATFAATIRCFSETVVSQLERDVTRYCRGIADAHGLDSDVRFDRQYPPTINDAQAVKLAADTVRQLFGDEGWVDLALPSMGAEDFSRVLQRVPGAMLFLGASVDGEGWLGSPENHSPISAFDDGVLWRGASVLSALAVRTLEGDSPAG
jgi:hippurate hydrolase